MPNYHYEFQLIKVNGLLTRRGSDPSRVSKASMVNDARFVVGAPQGQDLGGPLEMMVVTRMIWFSQMIWFSPIILVQHS